ncbi:MAG: hypothetical protein Q7T01_03195 [bacterium]|nr:hypothetical protein [bacterium]
MTQKHDDTQALRTALALAGLASVEPAALSGATVEITPADNVAAPLSVNVTGVALEEDGTLTLQVMGTIDGEPITELRGGRDGAWQAMGADRRRTGAYRLTVSGYDASPANPGVHCGADVER